VEYDHCINGPFPGFKPWRSTYYSVRPEPVEFARDKHRRLSYAKSLVNHAFLGLLREEEKQELADMLLHDRGKKIISGSSTEITP
jgi:hypothetical protein